ncbi:MAG: TIGR04086 family membrane protein [Clostridia bacterium]|nr:TIGR04086 family membrane protein [Clostridia bacterium]
MNSKSITKNLGFGQVVLDFLKGLIVSLILSLGMIIALAFSLKWIEIDDRFIPAIVLLVKGICVFVGAIIAIKGESKGLLKGVCFGVIYILLAFFIFSILSGMFSMGLGLLLDMLFAALLSGLVGIVKVNKISKY